MLKGRIAVPLVTFACLLTASLVDAADWTRFRGPNGTGVADDKDIPVRWDMNKNVVWKVAIPFGQSSPVLAGSRVYLTASEPDKLLTICIDAKTGRELWRRGLPRKKRESIFRANDNRNGWPKVTSRISRKLSGTPAFPPDR